MLVVCFFFFFSSRRRHTRSDRDWSSDVCSSDLLPPFELASGSLLVGATQEKRIADPRACWRWQFAGLGGSRTASIAWLLDQTTPGVALSHAGAPTSRAAMHAGTGRELGMYPAGPS